jgi:hypothetical protein
MDVQSKEDTDSIWSALVFTIISTAAPMMPMEEFEISGLELCRARQLAQVWHLASFQALHAEEFESKAMLDAAASISGGVAQLYWIETKNVEELKSYIKYHSRGAIC